MKTHNLRKMDKEIIVKDNPKIDKSLVENFESLEIQLRKLGVDTRPKFNIEPPLGGKCLRLYNK